MRPKSRKKTNSRTISLASFQRHSMEKICPVRRAQSTPPPHLRNQRFRSFNSHLRLSCMRRYLMLGRKVLMVATVHSFPTPNSQKEMLVKFKWVHLVKLRSQESLSKPTMKSSAWKTKWSKRKRTKSSSTAWSDWLHPPTSTMTKTMSTSSTSVSWNLTKSSPRKRISKTELGSINSQVLQRVNVLFNWIKTMRPTSFSIKEKRR